MHTLYIDLLFAGQFDTPDSNLTYSYIHEYIGSHGTFQPFLFIKVNKFSFKGTYVCFSMGLLPDT